MSTIKVLDSSLLRGREEAMAMIRSIVMHEIPMWSIAATSVGTTTTEVAPD